MIARTVLSLLCICLALLGCSSPITPDKNTLLLSHINDSSHFISLDKAHMQTYFASAQSQLLSLEQKSTKYCIAGQLTIVQLLLEKATQEHKANMEKDAFISLIEFDRQIRKIRCINQYITGHFGCGYTNNKTVLKRWYREGEFTQCEAQPFNKGNIEKKHILITETLHDFDQAEIKPVHYPTLNSLIDLVRDFPNSTLHIAGHTDSKGSKAYNLQLSENRARRVAKYFTDQGISPAQIVIEFIGEQNLREFERNDVSRVFNRFTTITLSLDISDKKSI